MCEHAKWVTNVKFEITKVEKWWRNQENEK